MVRFELRSWVSLCSFITLFFAVSALAEPPKREGVTITVPESELAQLSPSARETFETVKAQLEKRLFQFAEFDGELPESVFDAAAPQLVGLHDLYRAPTNQELPSLAGAHLDANQLAQIQKEGLFVVPSKQYPGQFHVWKLRAWLVAGSDQIEIRLQEWLSDAKNQITIQVWNRWNGASNPVAFTRGLRNILEGLTETLSLVVGLPHKHPLLSESEVQSAVNTERSQYLKTVFTNTPADIDFRLFDEELMQKVSPRLAKIGIEFERDTATESQLFDFAKTLGPVLSQEGLVEGSEPFMTALYQRLEAKKREFFHERLLRDEVLEALSPGIAKLLVNQAKAVAIVQAEEAAFQKENELKIDLITKRVKAEHPIRSKRDSWLQAEVSKQFNVEYQRTVWEFYYYVVFILNMQSLKQEAYFLKKDVEFLHDYERELRAKLTAKTESDRTFTFARAAWTKNGWTVEQDERGRYRITAKDKKYTVESSQVGWRLRNIWERSVSYVNNGLKALLVDNLYNGPLGLRSLVGKEPFNARWTVDSESGDFVQLDRDPTYTLFARIQRLYQARSKAWAEHENHSSGFFIGKVGKAIHWAKTFVVADVGYGFVGPLLVGVFQPTLTVLNAAVSSAATVTSIGWGPLSSLMVAGINVSLFDFDATTSPRYRSWRKVKRLFPAVQSVAQVVQGSLQIPTSVGAVPAHAITAAGFATVGVLGAGIRTVFDRFWVATIQKYAAIPKEDFKFMIKRISGPGLASNYFFQIQPDLALLSLLASIEKEALAHSRAQAEGWIQEPLQALQQEWAGIAALSGVSLAPNSPVARSFYVAADEQSQLVAKKFDPKDRFYSDLLKGGQNSSIRLSAANLESTLQQGATLSRNFFSKLFAKWSEEETKKFWSDKKLAPGDWRGVAKFHLASAFGDSILTSLEVTDKNFVIEVANPSATDLVSGLIAADLDPAGTPVDYSRAAGFQSAAQPGYMTGLRIPSLPVSTSSYCATLLRTTN